MNKSKGLSGGYRKITITLTPELEAFIDEVRAEIRKEKGYSLGRTEIIRAAVRYLQTLKMNLREVKDEEQLLQRITKAAKKR